MTAMNFMTAWICQVDNRKKLRALFGKWRAFGRYLLTPEDSRDSVYREPGSNHPGDLPRCASAIKSGFCVILAFVLAIMISRLQ